MTVNFPSGRSTSMPFRLFWRAPRISMQSFGAGEITRCLFPIFEPTGDSSRSLLASQIFRGATDQTPRPVARVVFAIPLAPRRLTNRKILCERRSLFAIPRDPALGVRQRHCDRCSAQPDRDRADLAANQLAI